MTPGSAPQTPILMYHAVSDAAGPAFSRYAVPPALFRRHMAAVARSGREPLTVRAYASRLRSGTPPEHAVVITFDDAFGDFLGEALPVLQALELTATLFVPTAFVGATSRWLEAEGEADRRVLGWDELRSVAAAGIEIGSHTHTHAELDRLPAACIRTELTRSKTLLEEALGAAVTSLAYPFGYHDRRVRRAARGCGYAAACQVGHRKSAASDDPYGLTRLLVPREWSSDALASLLARRESAFERLARVSREAGATAWRRLRPPARPSHG